MQKLASMWKSRTIWTLFAMFVVGGGNALVPVLPASLQAVAMALLGVLAGYYKMNPSQQYNPPVSQP